MRPLLALLLAATSGCIIVPRPVVYRPHTYRVVPPRPPPPGRLCPPASHWNGAACVPNGGPVHGSAAP